MPNLAQPNTFRPNQEIPIPIPPPAGAIDLTDAYAERFGPLIAGRVIGLEIRHLNTVTGAQSKGQSLRLIVGP